jgi:hypothetical protein
MMATLLAIWFGQVTVEKIRLLSAGESAVWSQPPIFPVSGWVLPGISMLITVLALVAAFTTWQMHKNSWVVQASLWLIVIFLCSPVVFLSGPIVLRKVVYFGFLLIFSIQSVVYLRRVLRRPNNRAGI